MLQMPVNRGDPMLPLIAVERIIMKKPAATGQLRRHQPLHHSRQHRQLVGQHCVCELRTTYV
jgi:hypothetical protein